MEQRIVQMNEGRDATRRPGSINWSGFSSEVPGSWTEVTLTGPQGAHMRGEGLISIISLLVNKERLSRDVWQRAHPQGVGGPGTARNPSTQSSPAQAHAPHLTTMETPQASEVEGLNWVTTTPHASSSDVSNETPALTHFVELQRRWNHTCHMFSRRWEQTRVMALVNCPCRALEGKGGIN